MPEMIRVLIVDSDAGFLSANTHILKSVHYDVLEARSGSEAIEKVKAERPDLVLMDMVLPDIDGVEVCKRRLKTTLAI
jgi:two-component system cell cycle response regulator